MRSKGVLLLLLHKGNSSENKWNSLPLQDWKGDFWHFLISWLCSMCITIFTLFTSRQYLYYVVIKIMKCIYYCIAVQVEFLCFICRYLPGADMAGRLMRKTTLPKSSECPENHAFCCLFSGTISVNTLRTPYTAPGESEILDLDDDLYLGGLPENKAGLVFPTEVWTALLNYGYVGCIRDLFIDGQSKDIRQMAEIQSTAGVKPSCSRETAKPCLSNPCKNNGVCRDGWNRYVCDCSGTGYLGRSCERGRFHKMVAFLFYRILHNN